MAVFKQIGGGNHTVEPFEANASHSFACRIGPLASGPTSSLSGSGFSINLANEPPTNYPIGTAQYMGGVTDGGFYSYPLFKSVEKYFYYEDTGSGVFSFKYDDIDPVALEGLSRYSFHDSLISGSVMDGYSSDAGFKRATALVIHKTDRDGNDRSTSYDTVVADDLITFWISGIF